MHSFDYARWVIGSPAVRVHCMAADSGAGPATYTLATVRYENGAIAHVECSWAHPASRGFKLRGEIVGHRGPAGVGLRPPRWAACCTRARDDTEWFDVLGDREFTRRAERLLRRPCRAGGPSPVPAAEGVESLRTALAALESARTGRTDRPDHLGGS